MGAYSCPGVISQPKMAGYHEVRCKLEKGGW